MSDNLRPGMSYRAHCYDVKIHHMQGRENPSMCSEGCYQSAKVMHDAIMKKQRICGFMS
jgi:hypothetical protein